MEKLNTFDLNEEFERLWQKIRPSYKTALAGPNDGDIDYLYETAEMFFNQGYENGYLDGLKDGRAL